MYTDSHAHLTYLKLDHYDNRPENLLKAMYQAGVRRTMAIMCQLSEYDDIHAWVNISADAMPDIGMSVGIHPCQDEHTLAAISPDELLTLDHEKVWAFGETGLDYYWDKNKSSAQKHSFAAHIDAAKTAKKPIIVHTRSAYQDTLEVLAAERCEHGIIHCFTEDYAFAKRALDMGLYISFSGILSFNKSQDLREVAAKLPLDRVLIETDSPYLAPVPKRGRDNEPTFVPYVAEALAKIYQKSAEEIGRITSRNFITLVNQYKPIIQSSL